MPTRSTCSTARTRPTNCWTCTHSSGHPNRPIIVMVHGGGWRNGDKLLDNVVLHKGSTGFLRSITFVSVNYKLDVGTSPLDQSAVGGKGHRLRCRPCGGLGLQSQQPDLDGPPAGAHLSNLAQSSRAIRAAQGVQPWLGSLLLDSAAYNVVSIMSVPHLPSTTSRGGTDPAVWAAGSPTLVLDARVPPFMCVVSQTGGPHGESDAENTQEYIDKATSFGERGDAPRYRAGSRRTQQPAGHDACGRRYGDGCHLYRRRGRVAGKPSAFDGATQWRKPPSSPLARPARPLPT